MPTDKAINFFKSLSASEKRELAEKTGIELTSLRNIFYNRLTPSIVTTLRIEKATKRKLTRYEIAPEIDWTLL